MPTLASTVELLHLFADPTRVRLVALLSQQELTVAEITGITELPQSRVSTHLGKLREAGVLRDRKLGASTLYTLNDGAMPAEARKMWDLLQADLSDSVLQADRRRCEALVAARARAQAWPDALAGQMERHYSPGRTWESLARGLLGLLRLGDVVDIGAGDGALAQLLAPRARSFTLFDCSEKMLEAARARLAGRNHLRFQLGDAHELPFEDRSFDQALLFNVLTHARTPARVLSEAARVLRRGGTLALTTLDEHAHADVTSAYHHQHPGFSPKALRRMLEHAGLVVDSCEVTSRERRPPYFQVVTAYAHKS
jgi:ArsR family transcriptional regulator